MLHASLFHGYDNADSHRYARVVLVLWGHSGRAAEQVATLTGRWPVGDGAALTAMSVSPAHAIVPTRVWPGGVIYASDCCPADPVTAWRVLGVSVASRALGDC
jgi:hypothetical protein